MANSASELKNLIVLTGPSGVGKGTVLTALLARHPELHVSISATTRSPRSGEVDQVHYYFLTRSQFEAMVAQGEFLEWAEFAGNLYGTPRQPVLDRMAKGERVLLEIELEGARQVRKTAPDALQIFMQPPSIEALEARIRKRGQETEEAIARRLARAKVEMDSAHEFDVQIMNDDFDMTVEMLEDALFPTALDSASTPALTEASR